MIAKVSALALFTAVTASSNIPPTANPDEYTLTCNSGGGFDVLANDVDPDGDPLSLVSVSGQGMSIGSAPDGIVVIGTGRNTGTYWGYYEMTDGQGGTSGSYITVNVTIGGPYCP